MQDIAFWLLSGLSVQKKLSFKGLLIPFNLIIQWKYSQMVVHFYVIVTFIWQRIHTDLFVFDNDRSVLDKTCEVIS